MAQVDECRLTPRESTRLAVLTRLCQFKLKSARVNGLKTMAGSSSVAKLSSSSDVNDELVERAYDPSEQINVDDDDVGYIPISNDGGHSHSQGKGSI